MRDLSQEQLAEKCGVSVSTLSRWESGTLRPHSKHQKMLAEILKVNENDFYVSSELSLPPNVLLQEILNEVQQLNEREQRYVLDCIRGLRNINYPN